MWGDICVWIDRTDNTYGLMDEWTDWETDRQMDKMVRLEIYMGWAQGKIAFSFP